MGRPKGVKNKPKQAHTIAAARRHSRQTRIRTVTKITAAQFEEMHRFCVNPQDIALELRRSEQKALKEGTEFYQPKNLKAVCDYPNHGYCFHGQPDAEVLKKINDKLGFKYDEPTEPPLPNYDDEFEELRLVSVEPEKPYIIKLGGKK
jgi:hypothetical protein